MPVTVVVFDDLGYQAEIRCRLRCRWRFDCRISATWLGRGRAMRALWRHLRVVPWA